MASEIKDVNTFIGQLRKAIAICPSVEGAEYLAAQVDRLLVKSEFSVDEKQSIHGIVSEFSEMTAYKYTIDVDVFGGQTCPNSFHKNMHNSILNDSDLIDSIKTLNDLELHVAYDEGRFLRAITQEGKNLEFPEYQKQIDLLFNANLALNDLTCQEGAIYNADLQGNQINLASVDAIRNCIQKYESVMQDKGIQLVVSEHDINQIQPQEAAQAPVVPSREEIEVEHAEPASSAKVSSSSEEPEAPGKAAL